MLTLGERDKIISFLNRTKVPKGDIKLYTKPVMETFGVNFEQALKKLINWAIDKKLELETVKVRKDGTIVNKITNLDSLLVGAV